LKVYWRLFSAFFRVGMFMFGGGYSMLPLLERDIVEKYHWATQEEILDYFALAQCTPGVIAVNTATMIGYRQKGLLGAAATTLGVIAPSIVIILLIASLLQNFAHIPAVQHAFAGIRVAVAALIASTVIKLIRSNVRSWPAILLCITAFAIVAIFDLSPVYVTLLAIIAGLVMGKCGGKR